MAGARASHRLNQPALRIAAIELLNKVPEPNGMWARASQPGSQVSVK